MGSVGPPYPLPTYGSSLRPHTMSYPDANLPHGQLPSFQPQTQVTSAKKDVNGVPLLGGVYKLVKTIGEGAYGVV